MPNPVKISLIYPSGLPFKVMTEILHWAKDNCPSYMINDGLIQIDGSLLYEFYFSNEKDALLFKLRWQ